MLVRHNLSKHSRLFVLFMYGFGKLGVQGFVDFQSVRGLTDKKHGAQVRLLLIGWESLTRVSPFLIG